MNKRISREGYLQTLKDFSDNDIIKIVTGIRGCGKSTLLELFQDHLREAGVEDDHILSLSFDYFYYFDLLEPEILLAFIQKKIIDDKMYYIFLNEIQNVKDFSWVVDRLNLTKNVDMYLTSSSAYILSPENAAYLIGRYIEIKMLPISFKEYVEICGDRKELNEKYSNYLRCSSFPYATMLDEKEVCIKEYLEGVYSLVILKNILSKKKVSDAMMLESVIRFVFDNIGNLASTKKISDTMTSDSRRIDAKTVDKYITALIESFVVYQAKRYDVKSKNYLKTMDKYYVVDIGLRYMLLGSRNEDTGHILENVIYLELLRRGYKVYVGKVDKEEVDFVAMKSKGIIYYQVSASVRDEETLARALRPLKKITDHYPKYILTLDEDPEADYDGIRRINALNFLLGE